MSYQVGLELKRRFSCMITFLNSNCSPVKSFGGLSFGAVAALSTEGWFVGTGLAKC